MKFLSVFPKQLKLHLRRFAKMLFYKKSFSFSGEAFFFACHYHSIPKNNFEIRNFIYLLQATIENYLSFEDRSATAIIIAINTFMYKKYVYLN